MLHKTMPPVQTQNRVSRRQSHGCAQQAPAVRKILSPARTATLQREEKKAPDPLGKGLKTAGKQLLKNKQFKLWLDPRLDYLKDTFWSSRPLDEKAAIIGFGAATLGIGGLAFAESPEFRQLLSGVNIGAPLGWIPYSPLSSFSYKLPGEGKSAYGFSAGFDFKDYLKLIPDNPVSGASFSLDTSYTPGQGLSVTGGKFGLKFLGGALTASGKTFTSLSPYPQYIPGRTPLEPPSWLKQSVPGLPRLQTGPGFEVMLMLDFQKLLGRLQKR